MSLLASRGTRRALAGLPLLRAHAPRSLCAAASSGLQSALERHNIPLESVPADGNTENMLRQLRFLETLGVPDMARMVHRDSSVLTLNTDDVAARHLEYLLSLGITRVGPMIQETPQLLSCDLTLDLHRKVTILQALGVKKIGPWLYKNRGHLVNMDVDSDIRPPIEFLRTIKGCHINKVVEILPRAVFRKGQAARFEKRVAYLREELGVGENRLGSMLSRWPYILTMSMDNTIKPKVCLLVPHTTARRLSREWAHAPRSPTGWVHRELPHLCWWVADWCPWLGLAPGPLHSCNDDKPRS